MASPDLAALATSLSQHVAAIRQAAGASPAGGGPAWDALLRHYGVTQVGADERAMVVQYLHLTRGAAPGELRMVMEAAVQWARREVERLVQGAPPSLEVARFVAYLDGLVDAESAQYEQFLGLTPPPPLSPHPAPPPMPAGPSIASIFQNAQQTSKEVPWAGMQYKQVATLTCVHCGGPQEQPSDFMCRYCRRPIAGSLKPNI